MALRHRNRKRNLVSFFQPVFNVLYIAAYPRCQMAWDSPASGLIPSQAEGRMASFAPSTVKTGQDFLPLKGTDHVEFYVGNARQAAYYYRTAFGMSLVAYAGPETGQRDRASYVVQQGKIRFVLTTSLRAGSPIADHVAKHGDGVRVIALEVEDARQAWIETTARGARSVAEPVETADDHGDVVTSSIHA